MMNKGKAGKIVFNTINGTIMVVLCLLFILPFWMIVAASLTKNSVLQAKGMSIFISGFNFNGYTFLFGMSKLFWRSMVNSLFVSVVTATLSMLITFLAAYALSRKYFVGYKAFMAFLIFPIFPMYFGGGMIPHYLVIRAIGIYNTYWAFILPSLGGLYYVFLFRNYLCSIPESMEEAARLDGAGDFSVTFHIFIPLSLPMMVTVWLMVFVTKWNDWLSSLLFVNANNQKLWLVQYVLKQMLASMQTLYGSASSGSVSDAPLIAAKNAGIVVSILPLVAIAPFVQKYFVGGVTAGAIKG